MIAEFVAGPVPGQILGHLGKMHRYEHVLVLLLAFGPILLLAVTIWIARKRIDEDEQ